VQISTKLGSSMLVDKGFCSFGLDKHDQAQAHESAIHFAVKKHSCCHHRKMQSSYGHPRCYAMA